MNAPNDDATRRLEMAKADAQAEVQQRLDEAAGKWDPFEMYTSVIDRTTGQEKPCDGFVLFANNRYHVQVRPTETKLGPMFWLSIRRNDRLPVRDWRDMQRIKNEILGEDVEGVELYSHEDRVVDTANQFHMWCLAPGLTFPFGFTEGLKLTPEEAAKLVSGARQR